jgi:hypothetical protein
MELGSYFLFLQEQIKDIIIWVDVEDLAEEVEGLEVDRLAAVVDCLATVVDLLREEARRAPLLSILT